MYALRLEAAIEKYNVSMTLESFEMALIFYFLSRQNNHLLTFHNCSFSNPNVLIIYFKIMCFFWFLLEKVSRTTKVFDTRNFVVNTFLIL